MGSKHVKTFVSARACCPRHDKWLCSLSDNPEESSFLQDLFAWWLFCLCHCHLDSPACFKDFQKIYSEKYRNISNGKSRWCFCWCKSWQIGVNWLWMMFIRDYDKVLNITLYLSAVPMLYLSFTSFLAFLNIIFMQSKTNVEENTQADFNWDRKLH